MRVLIDATPLQTGHRHRGVGTYTRELLRALLALDHDTDYRLIVHPYAPAAGRNDTVARWSDAVGGAGGPLFERVPANVELVRLPRPSLGRLTGVASHQMVLPALLQRESVDLFHSPGFVAALSVPGVPWRCPHPLVLTLHDFIPLHVPELFNDKAVNRWWYARQCWLARRAARLICVSEETRSDALFYLGVQQHQCTVIYEGVDPQVFSPRPSGAPAVDPPYLLFVGGDFPNKNRPVALAAFARLIQQTSLPHRLVMVGRDTTKDSELVRRYPALDVTRVERVAQVTQPDLARLYRDADLLLFPSTCEGFGLPVLEAMASGTPVITSTVSSLPEVAGSAAVMVDPHDEQAIYAALVAVLTDRTKHQELRTAGLGRAAQFTWEAMARRTLEVYREVADRRRQTADGRRQTTEDEWRRFRD
jgi:glycosyltransferase involved in cell wall biosynthesis